ncbi:tRNA (adenosine(37)-N6)-threonylcarbamoyltransferase complex dimerization subunit type 1 TsaB [Mariniradius saccharolyticus]|uniref:tRNA (adenosine(37)-N6)-threonylcarbamoyltransferase complex dimerization subunit type 1 TsaB n=1 Tax=Mariniradius saccharolyticus TaxID=1245591 RepID=UPI00058EAEF1|nr:tRNA (adenosine(37)-N6)-threonylcarbamoyltransferase complex dimerization subunit type 1 TsaB [Mariniradius saccharolyticus]
MHQAVTILSIETASQICSVALHRDGVLLGHSELNIENAHGAKLLRLIEGLFSELSMNIAQIQAVAVSAGPGSYTGLRIGVSTAKGICFAQDIPLIGVDTLEAMACQVTNSVDPVSYIIPMLDARRKEVYTAVFGSDGGVLKPSHALIVDTNPFLDLLESGKVYFVGDGVEKLKTVLGHANSVFMEGRNSAIGVGVLAYKKYLDGKFEDLAYFEPNYLKEFRVIASKKNPLEI